MYKGIVFDLDGTLVDSKLCFRTIRKQLGIPEGQWILEYLDQLPRQEKAAKLAELEQIELQAARNSDLYAGVLPLLEELRSKRIKLGIFTRNCSSVVRQITGKFKMKIDLVVTRDDGPPKPNPAGFKKFLETWNLMGHELLFVGDVYHDIDCGKQAGVKTALFTNGNSITNSNLKPDHQILGYDDFHHCIK